MCVFPRPGSNRKWARVYAYCTVTCLIVIGSNRKISDPQLFERRPVSHASEEYHIRARRIRSRPCSGRKKGGELSARSPVGCLSSSTATRCHEEYLAAVGLRETRARCTCSVQRKSGELSARLSSSVFAPLEAFGQGLPRFSRLRNGPGCESGRNLSIPHRCCSETIAVVVYSQPPERLPCYST